MLAIRAARAFTGREEIVKFEGGYHGSWEQVPMTTSNLESLLGIPANRLSLLHTTECNDVAALEGLMAKRGNDIAAILVEPVMGEGIVEVDDGYLRSARRLADDHGVLLVFDEVISARLSLGGRQGMVGVSPDLTALGKFIGGGFPVGAFGGRRDVMEYFTPIKPGKLTHAGTYNGNSMTMAAGVATLEKLSQEEIDRINDLGDSLGTQLDELLLDSKLNGRADGCGSLVNVHFDAGNENQPRNFSGTNVDGLTLQRFHRACLEEDIFLATRGLMCVSTLMDEKVIDEVLDRFARAVKRVEEEG